MWQRTKSFALDKTLTLELRIGADKVDYALIGLLCVNVVLNIDSLEDVLRWKFLHLPIGNGSHESRFSAAIGSTQSVSLATLEIEDGIVEQDLGTCNADVSV